MHLRRGSHVLRVEHAALGNAESVCLLNSGTKEVLKEVRKHTHALFEYRTDGNFIKWQNEFCYARNTYMNAMTKEFWRRTKWFIVLD